MKENIWGLEGCCLPNGGLCNACCILPNIELEGTYISVGKPAHSLCPYLADAGCSLHFGSKPPSCVSWHCSETDIPSKVDLIAQGLASGQVELGEATKAAEKYLAGNKNDIESQITNRAKFLQKITKERDLTTRDLTEP